MKLTVKLIFLRLNSPEDKIQWIFNVFDRSKVNAFYSLGKTDNNIQGRRGNDWRLRGRPDVERTVQHGSGEKTLEPDHWYRDHHPPSLSQVDVDQEVVLDCAESIMEALDNDGDGEITKVCRNIKIAKKKMYNNSRMSSQSMREKMNFLKICWNDFWTKNLE